jgi:hypothetical protein
VCKQGKLLVIESVVEQVDSEESKQEDNDDVGDVGEVTCIVHALVGYSNPQTMKVSGILKSQPVTELIDTGSTNNFLDEGIAQKLSIHVEHCEPFEVKLADGGTSLAKVSDKRRMLHIQAP